MPTLSQSESPPSPQPTPRQPIRPEPLSKSTGDDNRVAVRGVEQTAQNSTPEKRPRRRRLEIAYWFAGIAIAVTAIVTLILQFV